MTEIFRSFDSATIGYLQSHLETNGIKTYLRNEFGALTTVVFSETGTTLCVLDDAEVERGRLLLREYFEASMTSPGEELVCPDCGESSPGTFVVCWKCGSSLDAKS